MVDLLTRDDEVTGALLFDERSGELLKVHARAVLLATGGLGRVYRETTNPDVATGDGVAVAWRAGAEIANIEFVQFHPTALHVEGAPRFLLSEALRGEGAYLRNAAGDRFMARYHELAELAPRDVVSRSIVAELKRTGAQHVFLDLTHRDPEFIRQRFPRIWETCLRYGVDISTQPAPVYPAAHYAMGGVSTDLNGASSIARLYAAGEAACTGVHGANRLASNSLLEALVFGARAGKSMRDCGALRGPYPAASLGILFPETTEAFVRNVAWEHCGILRDRPGLELALRTLDVDVTSLPQATLPDYNVRNMHAVASLIAECALAREESRGAHFRTDFPEHREQWQRPSVVARSLVPQLHA